MNRFLFLANSAALGVGLAMDAFSVCLANGLREPGMRRGRMCRLAGVYAFFQFAMPMLGWILVHTIVGLFSAAARFVPFIAFFLLLWIGADMILSALREKRGGAREEGRAPLTSAALFMQGVATSVDALSVGFTIAEYGAGAACLASLIIAAVTFVICLFGLSIGKKAGTRLSWRSGLLGGGILIFIGAEILLGSFF